MSKQSPFYVGYLPKMPDTYRKFLFLRGLILLLIVAALAFILVMSQRGFSRASFELGQSTTLEGTLISQPVPMLRIASEKDKDRKQEFQDILLIGFGKNGAAKDISVWEKQVGHPLHGFEVQLAGTLIFYNGKTLLELTEGKRALSLVKEKKELNPPTSPGVSGTWSGEIIDPKCYFGVMKPGHGKAHRSCASLCIAGGIPPILRVQNETGALKYFFVMGEGKEDLNEAIKPFIAEAVSIQGELSTRNEWEYLRISSLEDIKRLNE